MWQRRETSLQQGQADAVSAMCGVLKGCGCCCCPSPAGDWGSKNPPVSFMGGKTDGDPRASAVDLVSKGHCPVQSAPLPWVRCRHGHKPTFMSQGGRWGSTGNRTLDPLAHCRAWAASPALVCVQHLGVSSTSYSLKNRYPTAQEKT